MIQARRGLLRTASVLTLAAAGVPQFAHAQAGASAPAAAPAASPAGAAATGSVDGSGSTSGAATSSTSSTASSNPIRAYRGDIRALWGDAQASRGDIRALWGYLRSTRGDIRALWGDVRGYWGDSKTFGNANNPYDTASNVSFWGDVSGFTAPAGAPAWNAVGDFWTANGGTVNSVGDAWNALPTYSAANAGQYAGVAQQLGKLLSDSSKTWGAVVTTVTGKSFNDGFVAPLLAKYKVDLSQPATLAGVDPGLFLFDYYDGLMGYTGRPHVDHWMKEADYTPAMTQQIGDGARAVIGVLDMAVSSDSTNRLTSFSPASTFTTGHGDAVASLLVADPTRGGVMGMAPMATVLTYNPFDETGTAGWTDIQKGVLALSNAGAGVVNASLGVPGWTLNEGWNQVFSSADVAAATKNTIFVIAAGNDGTAQKSNIVWNWQTNPNFIVVGSTNTAGTISAFSNMPGTACLTALPVGGLCAPGNRLMDHFITAPGEVVLVSDGAGGVTRMSGTSFAAPLVSGTIALLQDRWPWLVNYPAETVGVILKTARAVSDVAVLPAASGPAAAPVVGLPLGATAGANATYGVGALDVGAALSPIDFNNVQFYQYVNGRIVNAPAVLMRDPKQQQKWNAAGMYFYAFENLGRTFRDFAIPLDVSLLNQTTMSSFTGSMQQFQYYITSRLQTWMGAGNTLPGSKGPKLTGFSFSEPQATSTGLAMSVAVAPKQPLAGFRQSGVPYQMAVRLADAASRFQLTVGAGDGALAMGERAAYGSASDYDPYFGGDNPVLGFASGGAYGQARVALTDRLSVTTGVTQRQLKRDLRDAVGLDRTQFMGVDPYRAQAAKVAASYDFGAALVTATYTHLDEAHSILGEQSVNPFDMPHGSSTDAATLETSVSVTPTLRLDATGTVSRTAAPGSGNFRTGDGGIRAASWQFGLSKDRLLGRSDAFRVTLAEPLHVEQGGFDYALTKVMDRQTGELGTVTQHIDLGNQVRRSLVTEAVYGRTVLGGAAQVRLFGRANVAGDLGEQTPAVMGGAGLHLAF